MLRLISVPIEQPTKFELVIKLITVKALGLCRKQASAEPLAASFRPIAGPPAFVALQMCRENVMLMLFWLPMIILDGLWSVAADAASGEAERRHNPAGCDDEPALGRRRE